MGGPHWLTIKEGIQALKTQEGGRWKWAKSPGDGVTRAVFQCNAHLGCSRLLKCSQVEAGFALFGKGAHTSSPNPKKRKNSTLTYDDEEKLKSCLDSGSRPGGVYVAMLKNKAEELRAEGKDPTQHKRAEGGLEGRHALKHMPEYNIRQRILTYPACILMNLDRIPRSAGEHVS